MGQGVRRGSSLTQQARVQATGIARRASSSSRANIVWLSLLAGLAIVAMARPSWAQKNTFYLDRLQMAGAPDDGIAVWRPQMGEKTRFYGQWGLGFGLNPFRIENHIDDPTRAAAMERASGAPVSSQFISYANVGVELLDRFGFQLSLPVALVQTSNDTSLPGVASDAADVRPIAVMDMRLDGRVIVWRSTDRAVKLGLGASVWIPTGNQLSFAGDKSTSGGFFASGEYDLKTFALVANTGVQFRPQSDLNDFNVLHEWRWALGVFFPLRGGALRLGGQVFGSTGIGNNTFFDGDNTPLEWMAEGRLALDKKKQGYVGLGGGTRLTAGYAPDFRAVAVLGYWFNVSDTDPKAPGKRWRADRFSDHGADTDKDGIPDDIDLCPSDPEDHKPPNTDDGCPALPDRDGDGIPDVSDKCPDQAEDFDKIDDLDGCPEDDADKDGIADAKDACPKEPGEPSPEPAKNGCPQFIRRVSGSSEIQVLKQIEFDTGTARIRPTSYKIVDEVVRLMKVNPEIKMLSIEGHTDDRGSDELNEKLSQDRADSVMKYLVDHGVEAHRLSAIGYGEARPRADNRTAEGRQLNRRVEFHIKGQKADGGATPAPDGE